MRYSQRSLYLETFTLISGIYVFRHITWPLKEDTMKHLLTFSTIAIITACDSSVSHTTTATADVVIVDSSVLDVSVVDASVADVVSDVRSDVR